MYTSVKFPTVGRMDWPLYNGKSILPPHGKREGGSLEELSISFLSPLITDKIDCSIQEWTYGDNEVVFSKLVE